MGTIPTQRVRTQTAVTWWELNSHSVLRRLKVWHSGGEFRERIPAWAWAIAEDWTKHRSFQDEASAHLDLLFWHFTLKSGQTLEVHRVATEPGSAEPLAWTGFLLLVVPYQPSGKWGRNEYSVVVSLGPALTWNWVPRGPLLAQASCSITSSLILVHEHHSLQVLYVFRWSTTK